VALGPQIRGLLGRHERKIADLYRALFIDLDDFAEKIRAWAPGALRILEVGCGEGAVTEKLAETFPDAAILAIDITPRVGRLYAGRNEGVTFRMMTVQDVARDHSGQFDLVVMSDVMHHIPLDLRDEIIDAVGQAMASDGRFILKDWKKTRSPIHWLCHAGDRWLTGDHVIHIQPEEASQLVTGRLPGLRALAQTWIAPWPNNYALVFAR
jgi:2-polyprenyl-6-hydroxyphenyl methylase/3-demethylubiquinone-9 3-methyltransferase